MLRIIHLIRAKNQPVFGPPPSAEKTEKDPSLKIHSTVTHHGFVSSLWWKLSEQTDNSATFTLDPKDYPSPYADFEISLTVTLTDATHVSTLNVKNTGQDVFPFTCAFHTYFAVKIPVIISGIPGGTIMTHNRTFEETTWDGGDMEISGLTMQSLLDCAVPITLVDGGRKVKLESKGMSGWTLWNPGETSGSTTFNDLTDMLPEDKV